MTTNSRNRWTWRIARATLVAALLVLLAGPLMAGGLLGWQAGLGMFVVAALLAGLGGIFCLVALFRKRGSVGVVVAAAAGIAALAVPAAIVVDGGRYPPINDITTDTANPPTFDTITADMRGPGAAPLGYDPGFAAIQARGYPDLAPLTLPGTPADVHAKAFLAAQKMGWTIVGGGIPRGGSLDSGRIEATDTVPWWGFKDDIVIRLSPDGSGTKIDVRSKSRVGKGDLGVNAKRISDYLDALKA